MDYSGRLDAHLPRATRLIMVKADESVLVHSDGGSYKPLNWMSPPARLAEVDPDEEDREIGVIARWEVNAARTDDRLVIRLFDIVSDTSADLGVDPGLTKDGVKTHRRRCSQRTESIKMELHRSGCPQKKRYQSCVFERSRFFASALF